MSTQQNNALVIARKEYLAVVNNEKLKQQMAASLTDSDPAAVRRIVAFMANAAMKTPQLYRCDSQSIMKVMLDCCTLGIEPNGRDAHVIPYRTKNGDIAQLLIDYKGMITLAMKSERIRSIRAEVVCENDLFRWTNGKVEHSIEWKKPRGDMYAVYATALYKDGTEETAVLTKEEVDSVRARSRSGNNGPWVTQRKLPCVGCPNISRFPLLPWPQWSTTMISMTSTTPVLCPCQLRHPRRTPTNWPPHSPVERAWRMPNPWPSQRTKCPKGQTPRRNPASPTTLGLT